MPTPDRPGLLLVDDDPTLCSVLASALARRGFEVSTAHDGATAARLAHLRRPSHALIDLCLPDMSGLRLLARLKAQNADMRVVVLTGHATLSTAMDAIRAGAADYLVKPVWPDDIVAAFQPRPPRLDLPVAPLAFAQAAHQAAAPHRTHTAPAAAPAQAPRPLSVERVAWDHIQRVLAEHGGNLSATARALNMHRRTLQRKLGKNPPRA